MCVLYINHVPENSNVSWEYHTRNGIRLKNCNRKNFGNPYNWSENNKKKTITQASAERYRTVDVIIQQNKLKSTYVIVTYERKKLPDTGIFCNYTFDVSSDHKSRN